MFSSYLVIRNVRAFFFLFPLRLHIVVVISKENKQRITRVVVVSSKCFIHVIFRLLACFFACFFFSSDLFLLLPLYNDNCWLVIFYGSTSRVVYDDSCCT